MLTIGLTGGIASGKSYVASRFIAMGVPLLEADDVAREVVAPGQPALAEIAVRFGSEVIQADGALNRRVLRERVFADPEARKALEAITHPRIRARVAEWRAAQRAPYGIYSAAILIEAGMTRLVDRVLVIDAPREVQLQRLLARDGGSEALAQQMLAAQATRGQRLSAAHDVIDNGDVARDLGPQLARLDALYRGIARQH